MTLLVIVPARGHRKQAEALLESFEKTSDFAELMFILDPDDEETYEGVDWKDATAGVLSPRGTVTGKLNRTADAFLDDYDAIMFARDDNVFLTQGWDTILLEYLAGGSGMLLPDNRRRRDIPEIILITTDVIREMGFFAEPHLSQYYFDNAWGDLGKASGLLRYVPEVVLEHRHIPGEDEDMHQNDGMQGMKDEAIYREWCAQAFPLQAAKLRRKFNKDLTWILGKI